MAIYDFRIGAAPDFVMSRGKVIYPHKADLEFTFVNGAKTSVTVTNPSLSALIVEINEKFVAIGWSRGRGFAWTAFAPLTLKAHGKKGSGIILFKFPEEMGANHRARMIKYINDFFV